MASYGLQDVPLGIGEADSLGLDRYAKALASFIMACKTPMSVGIQGDWGLGKTSLMSLIQTYLESGKLSHGNQAFCYWVNTWQLSQFDLGNELPMVVMRALVEQLGSGEDRSAFKETIGLVGRALWGVTKSVAKSQTGVDADKIRKEMEDVPDPGQVLSSLKQTFADICRKRCDQATGEDNRVVIFVDDLDRLLPERAVELMEVMKNFLDVPHAVFVLAIDYQVVVKGLESKFKLSIKDLGGRSFFDKIIQVPFRMPSMAYEVEHYLSNTLKQIGFDGEESFEDYANLLSSSVGHNPRSIKRLCNNLLLLRLVIHTGDQSDLAILDDHAMRRLLFGALCMEWSHRPLYEFLVSGLSKDKLKCLGDDQQINKLIEEEELGAKEDVSPLLPTFARYFYRMVDQDGNGDISQDELRTLQRVLNVTAVTSLSTRADTPPPQGLNAQAQKLFNEIVDPAVRDLVGWVLNTASNSRVPFAIKKPRDYANCLGVFHTRYNCYWLYIQLDPAHADRVTVVFCADKTEEVGVPGDSDHLPARQGETYGEVFQQLGYDYADHRPPAGFEEDYEASPNVTLSPAGEEARTAFVRKLAWWWLVDGYKPPSERSVGS